MPAPFAQHPGMTAVALEYKQGNLIADQVLPRVPVDDENFTYTIYNKEDGFTIPETEVGRKGKPREVEFGSTEGTGSTKDHGLDAPVPNSDVKRWQAAADRGNKTLTNPLLRAARQVTKCLETRREKRVADLVFNVASYATDNKKILSGTSQWSDYANSDPELDIVRALDSMIMRPTVPVFGRSTWSILSRHPKLAAAIFKNGTTRGQITREQFAAHFELPDLPLIGDGWLNVNVKGQPVNMQRIWGNHAAFLYRDMEADTQYGVTFGFTAEFGERVAGTIEDPDMGVMGGQRARVGEFVKELIVAPDMGFLFGNAVAVV